MNKLCSWVGPLLACSSVLCYLDRNVAILVWLYLYKNYWIDRYQIFESRSKKKVAPSSIPEKTKTSIVNISKFSSARIIQKTTWLFREKKKYLKDWERWLLRSLVEWDRDVEKGQHDSLKEVSGNDTGQGKEKHTHVVPCCFTVLTPHEWPWKDWEGDVCMGRASSQFYLSLKRQGDPGWHVGYIR